MIRWSKLKADIERLMDPELKFQIYANSYRIGESVPVPRFWITIKQQIIWDWPKDFVNDGREWYFYSEAQKTSQLLRDYINTPEKDLLTKEFSDPFQMIPILIACDRRVGKRRLAALLDDPQYSGVVSLIAARLNKDGETQ